MKDWPPEDKIFKILTAGDEETLLPLLIELLRQQRAVDRAQIAFIRRRVDGIGVEQLGAAHLVESQFVRHERKAEALTHGFGLHFEQFAGGLPQRGLLKFI